MSMRISDLAVLLVIGTALAGCDDGVAALGGSVEDDPAGETIACALDGADTGTPQCRLERAASADGLILVVHHPDGSFRRFVTVDDGRGLVTADGAETAITRVIDGQLEATVDDDVYRFPATASNTASTAAL